MKRFAVFVAACVLLGLLPARAQGPDEQYVQIYNLIQEGDTLDRGGQVNRALEKYLEAQSALQRFQRGYPEWNPQVIRFRQDYLDEKVGARVGRTPSAGTSPPRAVPLPKSTPGNLTAPAQPPRVSTPSDAENQLGTLQEHVRQLQAEKSVLEAKLKESLSVQPAAIDPRELSRAEERIKSLQKEVDVLKVTVTQAKTKQPAPAKAEDIKLAQAQQALAEASRKFAEQAERNKALAADNKSLQTKLDNLNAKNRNTPSVELTKKALTEANRRLSEQQKLAAKLTLEKEALQMRLRSSPPDFQALAALRAENQLLKKQLADFKTEGTNAQNSSKLLTQAQARIAVMESDKEMLRLEKIALENRVKQMSVTAATPPTTQLVKETAETPPQKKADSVRIKQLERELADLQKKFQAALNESSGRKPKTVGTRLEAMENQMMTLRARLDVYEARQVPYTAEELALFKKPETKLAQADSNDGQKSNKQLPPGSATLVAQAQRYFGDKRLDKAEEVYLQVLHQDEHNVYTLANLAAIQLELGHLSEAEKHVKEAVSLAPNDAYSLTIQGYLRFRQEKYDEALDSLSRAAKLEPENAEIQNYLGLTLSQKGLRGPAETALRKAIQLNPSYGSAHNNLAVVYLAQKPPSVELARWHYQKALASGHPRNPELEKMLEATKLADKSQ